MKAKLGRNSPCPCGSGQKFKRCHGADSQPKKDKTFPDRRTIEAIMRRQEAQELLRNQQQGYGRPIISTTLEDIRFVAVGNTLFHSKDWIFFTDFLIFFAKRIFSAKWADDQKKSGVDHPLLRWLRKIQKLTEERSSDTKIINGPEVGFVTSLFRLGYALYLLAHNDKIPKSLISRLRLVDQFDPAFYETLVAAAFAVAGAKIESAEAENLAIKAPEFWATGPSGRKYAVEAKRRMAWRTVPDTTSKEFQMELRKWIRAKIYGASKKELTNPVYWFELSIGSNFDENDWRIVQRWINEILEEAQDLRIKGRECTPAYIFITNHTHMIHDDIVGSPQVAMLDTFRIRNFNSYKPQDLGAALDAIEEHRDIDWIFRCFKNIEKIPMTFDGTPSALLDSSGNPIRTFKIGDRIRLQLPSSNIEGIVQEVASLNDDATVILQTDDEKQHIINIQLSPEEAAAAATYGDAIFGKPQGPQKDLGDDPIALYIRMLEIYEKYPRESLLNQVKSHPRFDEIALLSGRPLLVRVAKEITLAMYARVNKRGTS